MKKNDVNREISGLRRTSPILTTDPLVPCPRHEDWPDPLPPDLRLAAFQTAAKRKRWPYWVPLAIAGVLLLLVITIWYSRGALSPSALWSSATTATAPRPAPSAPPSLAAKNP